MQYRGWGQLELTPHFIRADEGHGQKLGRVNVPAANRGDLQEQEASRGGEHRARPHGRRGKQWFLEESREGRAARQTWRPCPGQEGTGGYSGLQVGPGCQHSCPASPTAPTIAGCSRQPRTCTCGAQRTRALPECRFTPARHYGHFPAPPSKRCGSLLP